MLQAMNSSADTPTINALDPRGLSNLQRLTKSNDPKALKAAAQQFEALFLQMVLKSMRDATPREGLMDSDQSRMYESLLDQQLAQVMSSKKGVGLADVIARQLSRQDSAAVEFPDGLPVTPAARNMPLRSSALLKSGATTLAREALSAVPSAPTFDGSAVSTTADDLPVADTVRSFVARMTPDATSVAQETGIPAAFLIAHAALETGWGRNEPRAADGSPSYNLFGIKAGRSWSGSAVTASTVEYVQGVAQRRSERFRAYDSYASSFRDYANLLMENPRYSGVLGARNSSTFAGGLQRAGYATDPAYAAKLTRVIDTVAAAQQS